ncbi:MAG: SDR family NAD(P)-dependent oxidoreductase [Acidocella sp.]|nr:SDR family NAD(P)-dependent oxidoreductase [Acidocella sp.]
MPQTALITGAGSGIGRACALSLANAGWNVVLAGRRETALAETRARAPGGNVLALPTDVTDESAVTALFAATRAKFGRLDLLFNNAGSFTPATSFGDLTWTQWKSVTAVNLDAMFLCARAAFRQMRDQSPQGGRIINNGSISAHSPRPGSAPYTASKHGVTGLTKSIALDGRPFSIACGQIDIGNAATPMTSQMPQGVPQPDGRIMPEPVMDVSEIGRIILHMATLPLDANIPFITIMATNMPFIGRG